MERVVVVVAAVAVVGKFFSFQFWVPVSVQGGGILSFKKICLGAGL